jgi:hypothetical protein
MPKSCGRRPWRRATSGSRASRRKLAGNQTPAPSRLEASVERHPHRIDPGYGRTAAGSNLWLDDWVEDRPNAPVARKSL